MRTIKTFEQLNENKTLMNILKDLVETHDMKEVEKFIYDYEGNDKDMKILKDLIESQGLREVEKYINRY